VTRKQRILVGLAIVIALPLVGSVFIKRTKANRAAAEEAAQHETPIAVEALVASRGRVEQIFTLTGTIEADAQSRVVPKISGKISRVAVREGQQVRKGQVWWNWREVTWRPSCVRRGRAWQRQRPV